jgi:hypothetical protein
MPLQLGESFSGFLLAFHFEEAGAEGFGIFCCDTVCSPVAGYGCRSDHGDRWRNGGDVEFGGRQAMYTRQKGDALSENFSQRRGRQRMGRAGRSG